MRAILELKSIAELKKMIRETNIRGYSKLNKKQIIDKMMKEDKRFQEYVLKSHKQQQKENAKKDVKKTPLKKLKPPTPPKKEKPKEKIKLTITKADGTVKELKMKEKKPKGTHKMADGTLMTGSVHTKDSKPVKKEEPKETKSEPPKKAEPPKPLPKGATAIKKDLMKEIQNYYKKLIVVENKRIEREIDGNDAKFQNLDIYDDFEQDINDIKDKYKIKNDRKDTYFFNKADKKKGILEIINLDVVFPTGLKNQEIFKKYEKLRMTTAKKPPKKEEPKEKKPSAKELTDKAVEKAKEGGAKVVKAKPKKEKKRKKGKPLKETPKFEEIKKQKPIQNTYTSSKQDEDDFAKLFASLK